jgi:hypothetical protein
MGHSGEPDDGGIRAPPARLEYRSAEPLEPRVHASIRLRGAEGRGPTVFGLCGLWMPPLRSHSAARYPVHNMGGAIGGGTAKPGHGRTGSAHESVCVGAVPPPFPRLQETEALRGCLEYGRPILLTDDSAARVAARSVGVRAYGTIGLLVRSMRTGVCSRQEVVDALGSIPRRGSLHIRQSLLDEVIEQVRATAAD